MHGWFAEQHPGHLAGLLFADPPAAAELPARCLPCSHRMGVANRDIKLENTLLDGSARPLVKLADFGFSKDENYQSAPGSRVGTPAYLAPEVITNVHGQSYDAKVRHGGDSGPGRGKPGWRGWAAGAGSCLHRWARWRGNKLVRVKLAGRGGFQPDGE